MTAITKFLFETSFDDPCAAEGIAEDAGTAAGAETRRLEREIAAVRAKAYAEGLEEGRRIGRADTLSEAEARASQALETAARELTALAAGSSQAAEAMMKAGLQLAAAVMRKVMPQLARRHGLPEIEALVADCLSQLVDEPRVVIRVQDCLLDPLQRQAQALARAAGFDGKLVMVADPDLGGSDCRVEWADGGVVRNLSRLMEELDDAIVRALGTPGSEPQSDPSHPSPGHP